MRNRILSICCIFFLCIQGVYASGIKNQNILPNRIQEVDNYMKREMERSPVPGMAVVVVGTDGILFQKGYGVEVLGEKSPMTAYSSSGIGSLTKSFTALALLQLQDRGLLQLDDPVVSHLPWFRMADQEKSDQITIRMLLSNSSGIPSFDYFDETSNRPHYDMKKLVENLNGAVLSFLPGGGFEYSNENFVVAACILEEKTGMTYEDYVKKEILIPLEMNFSTMKEEEWQEKSVLSGHVFTEKEAKPCDRTVTRAYLAAGSDLHCSASDLGNYLEMLLNQGNFRGKEILSKEGFSELWSPLISFPAFDKEMGYEGGDWQYCLGWMTGIIGGEELVFHGGATGTMSSFTVFSPKNQIAVSILSNAEETDAYRFRGNGTNALNVLDILLGKPVSDLGVPLKKDPSISDFQLKEEKKDRYVGEYVSQSGGRTISVLKENENLFFQLRSAWERHHGEILFAGEGRAYFKTLAGSKEVFFFLMKEGNVTGLQFMGEKYVKKKERKKEDYKTISSSLYPISMEVPKEWQIHWEQDGFRIQEGQIHLIGIQKDEKKLFSEILKEEGCELVLAGGDLLEDYLDGKLLEEQSFVIQENGEEKHCYLICLPGEKEKQWYFMITCPIGELSDFLRRRVKPFLETVEV